MLETVLSNPVYLVCIGAACMYMNGILFLMSALSKSQSEAKLPFSYAQCAVWPLHFHKVPFRHYPSLCFALWMMFIGLVMGLFLAIASQLAPELVGLTNG